MDDFKTNIEHRRIIFGLSAIIKLPHDLLPQETLDKLPELMKTLVDFIIKIHEKRVKEVESKEKGEKEKPNRSSSESSKPGLNNLMDCVKVDL